MDYLIKHVASAEMLGFIAERCFDPWVNTPYEGYRKMDNKQKGDYGERLVTMMMNDLGHDVKPPRTPGHDRIINNIQSEIKFSLAQTDNKNKLVKPNVFALNHVSVGKDWERLIFAGVNPVDYENVIFWMTKEQFVSCKELYFNSQQGGKKVGNDDWMVTGTKLIALANSNFVNNIETW